MTTAEMEPIIIRALRDELREQARLADLVQECGGEGGKPGPCATGAAQPTKPERIAEAKAQFRHVRTIEPRDTWLEGFSDIPHDFDPAMRNKIAAMAEHAEGLMRSTRATIAEKAAAFEQTARQGRFYAARMHAWMQGGTAPLHAQAALGALREGSRIAENKVAALRSYRTPRVAESAHESFPSFFPAATIDDRIAQITESRWRELAERYDPATATAIVQTVADVMECGGKGGKPGPCPENKPDEPTKTKPIAEKPAPLPPIDPNAATPDIPAGHTPKAAEPPAYELKAAKLTAPESSPGASPPPSSTPDDRQADVQSLEKNGVRFRQKKGGGVNETEVITLSNDSQGVFKPAAGEHPGLRQGVPDGTQYRREVAAYNVAETLGMGDLVPPTTSRTLGGKDGSVQKYVTGATVASESDKPWNGSHDLARAAAFDYLSGHLDRHSGNWMTGKDGKLALIDNGLSFPTQHVEKDFFNMKLLHQAYKDNLSVPDVSNWKGKWPAVESQLKKSGLEPEAIHLTKQRFNSLVSAAPGSKFDDLPGLVPGRKTVANLLVRAEQRDRRMA